MRRLQRVFLLVILVSSFAFSGCGDDDPVGNGNAAWRVVFEDPFDGATLNATNWTQVLPDHQPYSLTGSGELRIDGDPGAENGALFVYNTAVAGATVRFTTKFRTTLTDPTGDDMEALILLNSDGTLDNGYGLLLESSPVGSSRDYELSIIRIVGGVDTELVSESVSGTQPQITAGNDYILEGVNSSGTITFSIKNGSGTVLTTVSAVDASYTGGKFGLAGDVNAEAPGVQSILFDYARIERYE